MWLSLLLELMLLKLCMSPKSVPMALSGVGDDDQTEHVPEEATSRPWYIVYPNRGHNCGENQNIDELTKKKKYAKRKDANDEDFESNEMARVSEHKKLQT